MGGEPSLVKYIVFIMRIFAYTTHRIQTLQAHLSNIVEHYLHPITITVYKLFNYFSVLL